LELEQWTTGGSTKRMGNLSSAFEKADSQWEQIIQVPPKKVGSELQ